MNPAKQINITYVLICIIAVLLSFFFHEFAHWRVGEALGNEMGMSLNSSYPLSGVYNEPLDYMIVSAAGPLFTIIQAIICYMLIRRSGNMLLYPFLFVPLYMRVLALAMSFMNPNDEARISSRLGIGTFTLPLAVCVFLFYIVFKTSQKNGLSFKFNLSTFALVMLFSSLLILADLFLRIHLI